MKTALLRSFAVLIFAGLFLFALCYYPKQETVFFETISAESPKQKSVFGVVFMQKENTAPFEEGQALESAVEETKRQEKTDLPSLNIVYPKMMQKRNIEASFDVKVWVDNQGTFHLGFPDGINKAFVKAVEDAFKNQKTELRNVEFVLPVEFKLY